MTLDEYREAHPDQGIAVSAYAPGEPVSLEVLLSDGTLISVRGETEQEAWEALLGPSEPPPSVFD